MRRLGLRQETEAAVRAFKQHNGDGAPLGGWAASPVHAATVSSTPLTLPRRATSHRPDLLREAPGMTGMLVVESVVPGGPSDGVLEPGDVLVRLNGGIVTEFLSMEALLDDAGAAAGGAHACLL